MTYDIPKPTDQQLREAYMRTFIKYAIKGIAIKSPETVPIFSGEKKAGKRSGRPLGSKNKPKVAEV